MVYLVKRRNLDAAHERRCVYCLEYKPSAAFNREHVIPQAFGRFGEGSPVLDCVCELCNGRLGRELEQSFSYASVEGVHRFVAGLRPASKFRIAQASDVDGVLIKEGPLAGCIADFRPSPDGISVNMVPRPQVGFGKTREGPFQWHSPGCLPSKEQLQQVFGPSPPCVQWVGAVDDRQVQAELASKGMITSEEVLVQHVPDGTAQADVLATITQRHLRAIAKIAFNYFAFVQPGLAYLPELNDVRRYVLVGTASGNPLQSVVPRPSDSPGRLKWHAVSVGCLGTTIDAIVLPLGILEYRLALNATPLVIPATFYSLHTFDFQTHQARRHGTIQ